MLTCSIDDRGIRSNRDFSLVYLLGDSERGISFPKDGSLHPNAAVCDKHMSRVPQDAFQTPDVIQGEVYGVANGFDDTTYGMGFVSFIGCKPQHGTFRYLSQEAMAQYLPKALKTILRNKEELEARVS